MKKLIFLLFLLIPSVCWAGCTGLPKTGQTTEYYVGDDGTYQSGLPTSGARFTDNADGTITDIATGLMWVSNGTGVGCNNGSTLNWTNAIDFCEGLDYATYTDWRLPNVKELPSIVDYSVFSPAINGTFFPNTQPNAYWSGTTGAEYTDNAWYVSFYDGFVSYAEELDKYYVRPVRGSTGFGTAHTTLRNCTIRNGTIR